jgi:hypothetical protein
MIRPCLFAFLLILTGACTRRIGPSSFVSHGQQRRAIIRMDEVLHLTPLQPVLDSAQVVAQVLTHAMDSPGRQVQLVVYYTGAGPLDYQRASVAAFSLRNLLIHQGYDSTRISYRAAPSKGPLHEKQYPYRRVDFVVTQP